MTAPSDPMTPPEVANHHDEHWFEPLADHMGAAYLRYSFTRGTDQEVGFLLDALELGPGDRVLDVGCGPGRHAAAFARRGLAAVGLDISQRFLEVARNAAPAGAVYVRGDARRLPVRSGAFAAAVSLCQGGFGLLGGSPVDEGAVLAGMRQAVRPGGRVAVSGFSAYFQVRHLEEVDCFDADRGVNVEPTVVRNEAGAELAAELHTTCFTPRELRLLAERAGLVVEAIWSVTPGSYARRDPDLDHPEFLLVARRPL